MRIASTGRTALRALALGAAFCAVDASAANAAVFGTQGIVGGANVAQSSLDDSLDLAKRAGARVIRLQADWSTLEPRRKGEVDPAAVAALDRSISAAATRGMKTILVLSSTPCWASSAPAKGSCERADANRFSVTRYPPADPRSAIPIATLLAGRFANRLAAFQVWNEPDQQNERFWAGPNKAVTYSALVRALYRPLKQAAPKVPVIVGSFVGIDGRWLKAMYKAGIKGFYDGLAVQFYSRTLYGLRATRAVQRAHGDSKPLWLTEFGYTDCYRNGGPSLQIDQTCVSSASAAQAFIDVLTAIKKRSWIAAAVQYNLKDDGPGGYTFGLVTADGREKASFAAVRGVLTGRVRAPRRPTVRLKVVRGSVVATGTASLTELLTVRVTQRGNLRFLARLVTDSRNRWRLVLPRQLGVGGLSVDVTAGWTGGTKARI